VEIQLQGVVSEFSPSTEGDDRITFVLDTKAARDPRTSPSSWAPIEGRTLVNWYGFNAVHEGDVVEVSGKIRLLRGFKNPGTFDYESYMHRRGIYTRMAAKGPEAVRFLQGADLSHPAGWRYFFRQKAVDIISGCVRTTETKAFLCAILLGERGFLSDEMKGWFRETGTFHILAISGLHVGLVYLIISLALTPLFPGAKSRAAAAIVLIWFYAVFTGAAVPVLRASIMLSLVLAGSLLDRDSDFLTSVAAAGFILFVLDPLSIQDVSFQLSFAAVVLLCVFEPLFSEKFYPLLQQKLPKFPSSILHKLAVTLFASVVVGTGLTPIIAYHFNEVSLVFPFANLLIVPLLSIVLAFGFASLFVGIISIQAAKLAGVGAELFSQVIFGIARAFSALPYSSVRLGSPPLWSFALLAVGAAALWWRSKWKTKFAVIGSCAGLALLGGLTRISSDDLLRITFFDVGDADACFLEFPNSETMLIDAGFSTPHLDCGENLIAPFFWRKDIDTIDVLMLTHPDSDHCGGAPFLLKNFRVRRLIIPAINPLPPGFAGIIEIARERGASVEAYGAGDSFSIGSAQASILNPPKQNSFCQLSQNDLSLVMRLTCNNLSVLFTGDAEKEALNRIAGSGISVRSQILKAPHHGLASSFSKRFIQQVEPELVVISGRAFRMNDRIEQRLFRYTPLCPRVLSTEQRGAIIVESNGASVNLQTCRPLHECSF
jgi:competence protein ComEC